MVSIINNADNSEIQNYPHHYLPLKLGLLKAP